MPTSDESRAELGAMLHRAARILVDREAPVLRSHGISMWEYVVLRSLDVRDGLTQRELAVDTRRDPTRLGAHLDALEERGLTGRSVDRADRRRYVVTITDDGRRLVAAVHAEIGRMEIELLGGRASALRAALLTALEVLPED